MTVLVQKSSMVQYVYLNTSFRRNYKINLNTIFREDMKKWQKQEETEY